MLGSTAMTDIDTPIDRIGVGTGQLGYAMNDVIDVLIALLDLFVSQVGSSQLIEPIAALNT